MPPYCIFQGCTKFKLYNYEGETKGIYCSNHKLENMVVVTNKNVYMIIVTNVEYTIMKVRPNHYIVQIIN